MLFTDVIRKKRDGGALSDDQIQFFVDGLADESIPAEQVSALAMAVVFNSMTFDEASRLLITIDYLVHLNLQFQISFFRRVYDKSSF